MATLSPSVVKKFRNAYKKGGAGGHDITHVERMLDLGKKVRRIIEFDVEEYQAAVWLHNADRYKNFARRIKEIGIIGFCREYLAGSGFSEEAEERIAIAVQQHSKFMDEPGDSTLLTALRITDKLDRFGALGILAIGAAFAARPYDTVYPFGYKTTVEGKMKTLYDNCFRVIEWYGMMPSDAARALVPKKNFRYLIGFVRQLGREMAVATGVPNEAEADLKKALCQHYERWR